MIEERPIILRPRRPRGQEKDESKVWAKAFKNLIHVVRMTSNRSDSLRVRGHGRDQTSPPAASYRQRCAVRVTYSGNRVRGQWAAHGRYIVRDSAVQAEGGKSGQGFDEMGTVPDVPAKLREWQAAGDPRMFKLIVSPEFGERVDLKKLVREMMTGMEADLGRHLEWVAAVHSNTQHPHAHVALRGLADGDELRLDRDFVKHGIRRRAEDECTAQLGIRSAFDRATADDRAIGRIGPTPLDRQLADLARTSPDGYTVGAQGSIRLTLRRRLVTLHGLGLAAYDEDGIWRLENDFTSILDAMQLAADRQKVLEQFGHLFKSSATSVRYPRILQARTFDVSGCVVAHTLDDRSNRLLMIVETADGDALLVPHAGQIEREYARGGLRAGELIYLSRGESGVTICHPASKGVPPIVGACPKSPTSVLRRAR